MSLFYSADAGKERPVLNERDYSKRVFRVVFIDLTRPILDLGVYEATGLIPE